MNICGFKMPFHFNNACDKKILMTKQSSYDDITEDFVRKVIQESGVKIIQ
jgi:hypothetical protein